MASGLEIFYTTSDRRTKTSRVMPHKTFKTSKESYIAKNIRRKRMKKKDVSRSLKSKASLLFFYLF